MLSYAGCIPVFVGPPFHAMPFGRHVDYAASSIFVNLTDTRKWFGKEKAQWHLNPRVLDKHRGKEGEPTYQPLTYSLLISTLGSPAPCSAYCKIVSEF